MTVSRELYCFVVACVALLAVLAVVGADCNEKSPCPLCAPDWELQCSEGCTVRIPAIHSLPVEARYGNNNIFSSKTIGTAVFVCNNKTFPPVVVNPGYVPFCWIKVVSVGRNCRPTYNTQPCESTWRCELDQTCSQPVVISGKVCRQSAGPCDIEDKCDGKIRSCPSDQIAPKGSVCRAAAGGCDFEELCTGASPLCPDDRLMSRGTVCGRVSNYGVWKCNICQGGATCPNDLQTCPRTETAAITPSVGPTMSISPWPPSSTPTMSSSLSRPRVATATATMSVMKNHTPTPSPSRSLSTIPIQHPRETFAPLSIHVKVVVQVEATATVTASGAVDGASAIQGAIIGFMAVGRCFPAAPIGAAGEAGEGAVIPFVIGDGPLRGLRALYAVLLAIVFIHLSVALAALCFVSSWRSSLMAVRFPNLSLKVFAYLYQGFALEGFRIIADASATSLEKGVGGASLVLVGAGVPFAATYWLVSSAACGETEMRFVPFQHAFSNRSLFLRRAVLPVGFWETKERATKKMLSAVFSPLRDRVSFRLFLLPYSGAMLLAAANSLAPNCTTAIGTVVAVHMLSIGFRLAYRPLRVSLSQWTDCAVEAAALAVIGCAAVPKLHPWISTLTASSFGLVTASSVTSLVMGLILQKRWVKNENEHRDNAWGQGQSTTTGGSKPKKQRGSLLEQQLLAVPTGDTEGGEDGGDDDDEEEEEEMDWSSSSEDVEGEGPQYFSSDEDSEESDNESVSDEFAGNDVVNPLQKHGDETTSSEEE